MSREAIYTWIYAMPRKTLRERGVMLPSTRTRHHPRRALGQRGAAIVGMVGGDDRPAGAAGRKVPGHWVGDLIIGAGLAEAVFRVGAENEKRRTDAPAMPVPGDGTLSSSP